MSWAPIQHMPHEDWQRAAARFVNDLDRCEHGRHMGDACLSCPDSASRGNPRMLGEDPRTDNDVPILGYDLGARPYLLVPAEDFDRNSGERVVIGER